MILSNPRPCCLGLAGLPLTTGAGDITVGGLFLITVPGAIIKGVEFATAIAGAHTIRCSFWTPDGTRQRYVDYACPGPGLYQGIFATPYTITDYDFGYQRDDGGAPIYRYFAVGVYHTAGLEYSGNTPGQFIILFSTAFAQYGCTVFKQNGYWPGFAASWGAGDTVPINAGYLYPYTSPIDPIIDYEVEDYTPPPPGPWPCPTCGSSSSCSCAGYGTEQYGVCSGYGLEDCAVLGPAVSPTSPTENQLYVPINSSISFQITDDNAIVSSTFKIYIDRGTGTFELAFDMTGIPQFQPGYDGPESSITDLAPGEYRSYALIVDPTTDFDRATVIRVKVEAVDSAGNPARIV